MKKIILVFAVISLTSCDQIESMAMGVNYTAKSLCSCLFVMERGEEVCYADMVQSAKSIPVEIDQSAKHVRASIFGIFVGEAGYREGLGCLLD